MHGLKTYLIIPQQDYFQFTCVIDPTGTRGGTALQAGRHCTTSRKVAGSIPDGVIDIILPTALWPWD